VKRSYLVAAGIVLVVTVWMLTGIFAEPSVTPTEDSAAAGPTRVQVAHFEAQQMLREVVVHGQTQARQEVIVRAEIPGQVAAVIADKGAGVSRGDVLARMAEDERPQQLQQARALVRQRELEYQAAKSLKSKGLQAERQLAEAETLLRTARVQLRSAELNQSRLTIRAPFDGQVQARHAELGDYLQPGDPAYTVVSLDPLVIRGDVAESEIGKLQLGMEAMAELSNGVELAGRINFIAPVANTDTRTYTVEVEAPNPLSRQPGGMSATLRVPLERMAAHKVSPALLSLNDAGVLGLKSIDEAGVVQFHPVEILKSERDGLWLGGLPPDVELITVGQGFVRAGDRVEAVSEQ
jgi:multidrug efflux system membrane fusion protein